MRIFISHAHEELSLALAWKNLLENLPRIKLHVDYSHDRRREQIEKDITKAAAILAIVTPESNDKPRIAYESGYALGGEKTLVPIVYALEKRKLHPIYSDRQAYDGEEEDSVKEFCHRLIEVLEGPALPDYKFWQVQVDDYMEAVQSAKAAFYSRAYFRENFHTAQTAGKLEGDWFAKWTELRDDGTEKVFEFDTLYAWTTENRIRMVGDGQKGKDYPMEGVVSWKGQVAMSYWSTGEIPICGGVLMKPVGARLDVLEGTWEGYTARTLDDEPTYFRGRVAMARKEEDARERWGLLPPEQED